MLKEKVLGFIKCILTMSVIIFLLAWFICFGLCLIGLVLNFISFIGSAVLGGHGWIHNEGKLFLISALGSLVFGVVGFFLFEIYTHQLKQLTLRK